MHDEIELKLQAPPAALRDILESEFISKISVGNAGTCRLVSTYFDTPRHTYRKDSIALRVRQLPDGFEQTVKAPVPGTTGLQTYREWNSRVLDSVPVIAAVDDPEVRSILSLGNRHKRLLPLFTTDVERHTLPVRFGGCNIELALDIGRIEAGNGNSEAVSELELELLDGDSSALLELALQLTEHGGLSLGYLTKAERGYALASPTLRQQAAKANKERFAQDTTVPVMFQAILGGTLEHLRANELPVAAGHPEGVHQARVAIRRLRAALWTFREILPGEERKTFNREFRWFQRQLSPARDWHVFVDETVPAVLSTYPGRRATAARLRKAARAERTRVTVDIAGLFRDGRYTRLILAFTQWVAEQNASMENSLSAQPVTEFAAGILDESHRIFLSDTRPLSRMPARKRHTLRKRGKKLRYACEFFSSLWPGHPTEKYLHSMKHLQEALGVINDVSVAGQSVGTLDPDGADSRQRRLVSDWSDLRLSECLRKTQPKWRKFQKQEPFWRSG
jgi:inorganic triphosphatase YgiF